jgi:hypothetical protein
LRAGFTVILAVTGKCGPHVVKETRNRYSWSGASKPMLAVLLKPQIGLFPTPASHCKAGRPLNSVVLENSISCGGWDRRGI